MSRRRSSIEAWQALSDALADLGRELVCLVVGHRWDQWELGHGFLKICRRCGATRRLS